MRHNKKFNHLGRKKGHRDAMLANMASSLIEHKRINTTLAKAKALRTYVEPLISRSKEDSTHSRRMVFRKLQNKDAVSELFREVAARIGDRPGGYTRIIKTGNRLGDNAEMAMIELVDFNELYVTEQKKTKSRRSRRGGTTKAKAETAAPAAEATPAPEVEAAATAEAVEAPEAEAPAVEETAAPEAAADVSAEASAEPEAKAEEATDAEEKTDDNTDAEEEKKGE